MKNILGALSFLICLSFSAVNNPAPNNPAPNGNQYKLRSIK